MSKFIIDVSFARYFAKRIVINAKLSEAKAKNYFAFSKSYKF